MISKSKSMNNLNYCSNMNKLDTKNIIAKSSSYNEIYSLNDVFTNNNTVEIIKHIPYVSLKNISKCLVSEIFPQSILENEKSNESLDLAICLADPEPDIYDYCLSKNSSECCINRCNTYRNRRSERNEQDEHTGDANREA